jgi:hypothetical protein
MKFRNEILNNLNDADGWGIEFLKFIIENVKNSDELYDILNTLRSNFKINFIDARRGDFYAEIYFGLTMWNSFFEKYGMTFSLSKYLDHEKFRDFIIEIEHFSQEENEERHEILGFMDWIKTKYALRKELIENASKEGDYEYVPETVSVIDQLIKFDDDGTRQWLYFTQTAITEYKKENRDFPYNTLTEVADAIAEFYGQKSEIFYPRKAVWIGKRSCKAVRIPYDDHYQPDVNAYDNSDDNSGNDSDDDVSDGGKGPPIPNRPNQNLTETGQVGGLVQDIILNGSNHSNQKSGIFFSNKIGKNFVEKNAFFPVRLVRNFIQDDEYSLNNNILIDNNNLTKNLTKPNQGLGEDKRYVTLIIKNETDIQYGNHVLHCFPNDILRIEYNPSEYNSSDKKGDQERHSSFDEFV